MLVHVTAGLTAGLAVLAHAGDTTEPAPLLAEAGYRAAANLREVAQGHMDAYIAGGGAADPSSHDERVPQAHGTYDGVLTATTFPAISGFASGPGRPGLNHPHVHTVCGRKVCSPSRTSLSGGNHRRQEPGEHLVAHRHAPPGQLNRVGRAPQQVCGFQRTHHPWKRLVQGDPKPLAES